MLSWRSHLCIILRRIPYFGSEIEIASHTWWNSLLGFLNFLFLLCTWYFYLPRDIAWKGDLRHLTFYKESFCKKLTKGNDPPKSQKLGNFLYWADFLVSYMKYIEGWTNETLSLLAPRLGKSCIVFPAAARIRKQRFIFVCAYH